VNVLFRFKVHFVVAILRKHANEKLRHNLYGTVNPIM